MVLPVVPPEDRSVGIIREPLRVHRLTEREDNVAIQRKPHRPRSRGGRGELWCVVAGGGERPRGGEIESAEGDTVVALERPSIDVDVVVGVAVK